MIKFRHKGDFKNIENFFKRNGKGITKNERILSGIEAVAQKGVEALEAATPKRSGKTSKSWSYSVDIQGEKILISWTNSNSNNGVNIATIIQLGHATGTGGYVAPVDYINPAMAPIFQKIADDAWAEVTGRAYY